MGWHDGVQGGADKLNFMTDHISQQSTGVGYSCMRRACYTSTCHGYSNNEVGTRVESVRARFSDSKKRYFGDRCPSTAGPHND